MRKLTVLDIPSIRVQPKCIAILKKYIGGNNKEGHRGSMYPSVQNANKLKLRIKGIRILFKKCVLLLGCGTN